MASTPNNNSPHWNWSQTAAASVTRWLESALNVSLLLINSRPLDAGPADTALPDGHEIRYLTEADLPKTVSGELELGERFVRDALARGDRCIAYFDHGELVSYFWTGFSRAPMEWNHVIAVPEGYSYAYKALTVQSHRGQRLQQSLTQVSDELLVRDGFRHNIEYMHYHNLPQRTASRRYGNQTIGYGIAFRVRGRSWVFSTAGVRRSGLRIERA